MLRKSLTVLAAAVAAASLWPATPGNAAGGRPGTLFSFYSGWSDASHTALFGDAEYAGNPRVRAQLILAQGGPGVYSTGSINDGTYCTSVWSDVRSHQLTTAMPLSGCTGKSGAYYLTIVTRTYDRESAGWSAYQWSSSTGYTP